MAVKIGLCFKVRRATDCVVGGSFRASRLGVYRRFYGSVSLIFVFRGASSGTSCKEARLGRRVSECIVVGRVGGLCGGCLKHTV